MSKKTLTFDCNSVLVEAKTRDYFTVEIETAYPNEILNEFSSDEIIENYEDLHNLYKALKYYFDE